VEGGGLKGAGERRVRREPPPFRVATVQRVEVRTPRLRRITLAGADLAEMPPPQPAASVRILLPEAGGLIIPEWNGNEFLLPSGRRPLLRTFTPRRFDPAGGELDLEIVLHGAGAASAWAQQTGAGDQAAVSGPGRGYEIDESATVFLLAGDETALPAISQLLEHLPDSAAVEVHVEIGHPHARLVLPAHPGANVAWHQAPAGAAPGETLVAAIRRPGLGPDTRVWAAGEAAAMQRLRRYFFDEGNLPRRHVTVRGYWKWGRTGT